MTRTPSKQSTSPALEQARRLQAAADIFNRELFDGALPPTMLRLERQKTSRGYYSPDKFMDAEGGKLDCITLNSTDATDRPLIELLSTLVHEQCHQYVCRIVNEGAATGGHGPEWRRKMLELGLPPIRIGATWRQATHSIDPDGAYATCFRANLSELQRLPWQELARDAVRGRAVGLDRIIHQCPSCGSKARARPAAELLCGTCTTAQPLNFVRMIPEIKAEGGGKGTAGAKRTRTDYPEPSTTPSLPVWTDEAGREMRLHCGIDHPPQTMEEALVVMFFGVQRRDPALFEEWIDSISAAERRGSDELRKRIYKHRAKLLHPDVEGGSELAFKALQVAHRMLDWDKVTPDATRRASAAGDAT